ncbi:CHAT domain-containing tetratricopeptide repeat protein [Microseira wollei]|uniref:TPR domain protein n=1 Tax=Microseira wollei NIES-4236 TaxID=2530354 RepID=A0AAV3XA27_9CYAN|nr:tetratricopeptide repeat protein [Microseira wollei]GET37560.1 TPR domain protein [Microseira wollei NIES-4236]
MTQPPNRDAIEQKSPVLLHKVVSLLGKKPHSKAFPAREGGERRPSACRRGVGGEVLLALLLGFLLVSESVPATPRRMGASIAQQPGATGQEATRAAAERALQEGTQLLQQGTAESLRQGIEKWEEALRLYRTLGEKGLEAFTLLSIGRVYSDLGEKQKALDYFNQSLPLWRAVGSKSGVAITLYSIGRVYEALGEKQKALDHYNQSLPLFRATGEKAGEAITLYSIGGVYYALGEQQKALDYFNQSLPVFRATADQAGEATTLSNIGGIYSALGEKHKALDYFNQSLPLSRAVGDKAQEARTLSNIGRVYDDWGEKQKALDYFNQSLPLARAVGDRFGESITLNNIGRIYDDWGEKQKALDYFNQSLPLARAVGDQAGVAVTLNNIGLVYDALGEKQRALDYYNQSLPLSRTTGDKRQEAVTLNNISQVYSALGEKQKALDYLNQSLPVFRAVSDRIGEATTLNNIGQVYLELGEKQKALDYFNQSLALRRALGNKAGEADSLNNIGAVYFALGEKQKALDYYNQSLPLSRVTGNKSGEALTLSNFAYLERDRNNLNAALTNIEAAIKIIEQLRSKIISQDLRASYFATVQDYYKFYIDLLMQLHKTNPTKGYDALALHISERARARSFLELLAESGADIRQGVDPQLLAQERSLLQQLNAAEATRLQPRQGSEADLKALEQKIATLSNQLQELEAQIKQKSPRYAALKYPDPLTLPQIQQQVLDNDTILLQYSLGDDRSYLWAVTKTGITSYELPKRADIEAAVQTYLKQIKSKSPNPETGTQLSQILLAPVANQLGNQRLLIVGDGVLQLIPFAALPLGQNPLIAQNEIVTLPSASSIAILRQQVQGRTLAPKAIAAIADPVFESNDSRLQNSAQTQAESNNLNGMALTRSLDDFAFGRSFGRLPQTRQEADAILALFPKNAQKSAFDFQANLATANSPDLAQYRIVHIATHGLLNETRPELSGLVFSLFDERGKSQEGFLLMSDIFNLDLPAELVVLSACDTGLAGVTTDDTKKTLKEAKPGEGISGLTRGFMYAGAKRVVVSLWSVSTVETSELMQIYYQKMLRAGLNPVAAMRATQLEMIKSQQWKAPYYWASFVVQGEWR